MFTGIKPADCGTPSNQPSAQCAGWVKGIQVESGGTLRMYGQKGVGASGINSTYLTQAAGPSKYSNSGPGYIGNVLKPVIGANNILYVSADVTGSATSPGAGWKKGDWIAVATTSFSPWETEFVQLASDPEKDGSGSKLTLVSPLNFYHFGGSDPGDPSTVTNFEAGANLNYGVDERAEVGLISRNIVLTSDSDAPGGATGGIHWGGEIRILAGFTAVSLQGVELQKFGKQQVGSYRFIFTWQAI